MNELPVKARMTVGLDKRFRYLLSIILGLFLASARAQVSSIAHYTTAEGLSDNRITDIIKDRDGFMWFGSWAGITRFDGSEFLTFKSYPGDRSSLKSNRIDEIVEDSKGPYLWVRGYDRHIYRFDKRTEQFVPLAELLSDSSLSRITFQKISNVKDGRVWLRSDRHGIFLISNSWAEKPVLTRFSKSESGERAIISNSIHFSFSDKAGNVWLGTDAGVTILKPFKGGFKAIRLTGLHGKVFRNIAETKDRIYMSDTRGELLALDRNFRQVGKWEAEGSSFNHLLAGKRHNKLFATTSKGELIQISSGGKKDVITQMPDGSPLFHIYEDRAGRVWVESERFGVIKVEAGATKHEVLFPAKHYTFDPQVRNLTVFEDKNNKVWLNLKGKLSVYDPQERSLSPLPGFPAISTPISRQVVRTFYDESGVLWLAIAHHGIARVVFQEYDFKQQLLEPSGISREENEVRGIFADRNNRIWAATKANGLYLYENGKQLEYKFDKPVVNGAGIYAILQDKKGRVWMGTKSNGLIMASPIDPSQRSFRVEQFSAGNSGINTNSIYCLLEDRRGRLWAGSYEDGLIRITEQGGRLMFETVKHSFKNYPRDSYYKIRHMAEDGNGDIWIGTTDGLLVFSPDGGMAENYRFKQYKKEPGNIHSLGGNDIQFIFRDSRKNMWLLTTTGGLNLAVGKDPLQSLSFENYSTRNGLPSDFLLSCAEDRSGNLWIATQNGLSKFSVGRKKFQNFSYNDGLQSVGFSEASCAKLSNGELVFGTERGILSFDPRQILTHKISAPLALTNLQINGEDISPGEGSPLRYSINNTTEIELEHDQNVISISFAALDFHVQDKQNYACRLVGFDNEWRSTEGQRKVVYTRLPPGEYTFQVKSLNDELYQNLPVRSLTINILPPVWQTWWAYAIYAILILIALILIRRAVVTILKLRQGIVIERRLADLKLNFFTQISHELRTPLTLIINPAEEVLQKEKISEKGRDYMNLVVKNTRRMLRMVNQVLDLRKVQSGEASMHLTDTEIIGFVGDVIGYFRSNIEEKQLKISIHSLLPELNAAVDREKLEIVIFNLVANAVKFSPARGNIQISVDSDQIDRTFRITVADEGPGVGEDELQSIFRLYYEGKKSADCGVKGTGIGLALSRELVHLHGGRIYAERNEPRGLKVVVELKLRSRPTSERTLQDDIAPGKERRTPAYIDEKGRLLPEAEMPLHTDISILLVEDNMELREFLANKFGSIYKIITAADGQEGLEMASAHAPDLILSDIMMPVMDGIEMLDKLKHNENTSHIPVILLSARYSVESQIEGLKYGADYYITKPFDLQLLETAISSIISKRKRAFQNIQEDDSSSVAEPVITEYDRQFLAKVLQIVESKLVDSQFNIDDVAGSLGMSRSSFYRKFKSLTNITPVEFVRETRLKKSRELMDAGEDNVSVIAYSVGFSNPKYFSSCFRTQYHQTPSEYLKTVRQVGNDHID